MIGSGWDQADINNYVLYYNGQVEASLAVPAPGLDMSMKRAINTIIRTKLQAQEEEEQEEEQEIGLVTPANPKVPSTGEPPEPDLGMLPPGPRKTVGGRPKPGTSTQLKPKPSARSVREAQEEYEEGVSKEEGGRTQEGSSQVGKERWPESSKRRSEKALQISAGNCCPEADQAIPENHRTFD